MQTTIRIFQFILIITSLLFFKTETQAQRISTNPTGNSTSGICGNAQQYQKVFDILNAKGFRPVKVSAKWAVPFEELPAPHFEYSATFQKQANSPAWIARHVLNPVQYQTELDKWTKQGYMPTDINIAQGRQITNYTLVMEKMPNLPQWVEKHGINQQGLTLNDQILSARGYKRTLTSQTTSGLFAALWVKN